jgi:SAM-dependent methyltransferase
MSDTAPSRGEVEALLERERFRYQRIELPYGLATQGQDRTSTANVIFPADMSGASVLDIGCCYGFFLYEARKRGATKLVGTEIKPDRFRQANLLRDVLRADDVEFLDTDVFETGIPGSFDYILLLNVLHHLPEPVKALRAAVRAARRALILEFPTPGDKRFRGGLPFGLGLLLERLPVIGVASPEATDQTFLFSRSALERVLTEHDSVVKRIDFVRSPKQEPHRLIAIVHTT